MSTVIRATGIALALSLAGQAAQAATVVTRAVRSSATDSVRCLAVNDSDNPVDIKLSVIVDGSPQTVQTFASVPAHGIVATTDFGTGAWGVMCQAESKLSKRKLKLTICIGKFFLSQPCLTAASAP